MISCYHSFIFHKGKLTAKIPPPQPCLALGDLLYGGYSAFCVEDLPPLNENVMVPLPLTVALSRVRAHSLASQARIVPPAFEYSAMTAVTWSAFLERSSFSARSEDSAAFC